MGRIFVVFGVLMTLAACGVGGWMATRLPLALFVVPSATDVHVATLGWNTWQISYHAPGAPYGWYSKVGHRLEGKGWTRQAEQYIGGPLHEPATYTHMTSFGFIALWERMDLDGDRQGAHVRMRDWIDIQPLKL